MAIYTMQNYSMLSAKPLDAKRIMTYNQWNADDDIGLSYPGQLYYDPNTGWFNIYGKDIDDVGTHDKRAFSVGVDGLYVGSNHFLFYNNEFDIYGNSSYYGPYTAYAPGSIIYTDIDPVSYIDFSNNEFVFGNSNEILSNINNKVIVMYGTGLKTVNPSTNQLIIGQYNYANNPSVKFIIGNGTDDTHRSDILAVSDSGIDIYGYTTVDSLSVNTIRSVELLNGNAYWEIEGSDCNMPLVQYVYFDLIQNFITKLRLKIYTAFDSTAKLNIFTYTDKTTKTPTRYILQNYPIGQMSAGDIAVEDLFDMPAGEYLGASISGNNNTNSTADMLIQYSCAP